MNRFFGLVAAAALMMGSAALAEGWKLDGAASKLAFGSIKKDVVGEVHSFTSLSGSVSQEGAVDLTIDLPSVETLIDIRNERVIEHVFGNHAKAHLRASIDMEKLSAMVPGDSTVMETDMTLSFLGSDTEFYTELFIARLSEHSVIVSTNDMVFLEVEDLGITAGIDKLQQLADLPGITRAVPVTARMMFRHDGEGS